MATDREKKKVKSESHGAFSAEKNWEKRSLLGRQA